MDEYEQYLADAEYEQYLKQAEQQRIQDAMGRAGPVPQPVPTPPPGMFDRPPEQLGADYGLSFGQNLTRGVSQIPDQLSGIAEGIGTLATDPIGSFQRAGIEGTARTVGPLAMGAAGAMSLGGLGATGGTMIGGPIGGLIGGAAGGALGLGAGLLGFDATTNFLTGTDKPVDEYLKDFAYNVGSGTGFELGGRGVGAGGRAIKKVAYDPFTLAGAEARVGSVLSKNVPDLVQQIDTATAAGAADPFLEFKSLGELLDNNLLKNSQRTIERLTPESYARAADAGQLRTDAQFKQMSSVAPETPNTPMDAQRVVRESLDADVLKATEDAKLAKQAVDSRIAEFPTESSAEAVGGSIREGFGSKALEARGKITEQFNKLTDDPVNTGIVEETIAAEYPKYFREVGKQASEELQNLINSITKTEEATPTSILDPGTGKAVEKKPIRTLRDIQALRNQALDIANGSDPKTAAVADKIANSLLAAGEEAVASGAIPAESVAAWKEGIKLRKEFGGIYENSQTPAKSILKKQPYGEYALPPSAIPEKVFRPGEKGSREAVKNYKAIMGTSEEVLRPLHQYAIDSFRAFAVSENGIVDAGRAGKWLARRGDALAELPELKAQLSSVEKAQTLLDELYGRVERTQAEIQKGAFKEFLNVDPEKAIPTMLSGGDMIKRTVRTVQYLKSKGAPGADGLAGLQRGVIEYLRNKSFSPSVQGGIDEALAGAPFKGEMRSGVYINEYTRIRPALEKSGLFTKSQLEVLDAISNDRRSMMSIENAKSRGGSDTMQLQSNAAALARMSANYLLKNLPGGTFISNILTPLIKVMPEDLFKLKMEEALMNPRLARDLAQKASTRGLTRVASEIFKSELEASMGVRTATTVAKTAPVAVKKQEEVTSKKSFPNPEELFPKKR